MIVGAERLSEGLEILQLDPADATRLTSLMNGDLGEPAVNVQSQRAHLPSRRRLCDPGRSGNATTADSRS
jgi:hypothetical protein